MTSRQPSFGDDFEHGHCEHDLAALAADPFLRIIDVGPLLSLAVHPIEHGQAVEFSIAPGDGGDVDLWLTPDKARELAMQLWSSADDADEERGR